MTVFNDVEEYRTLLGIQRYQEQVIENKQRASLYLLQLGINCPLDFCHLECPISFDALA